jgi:SpoIID/LytB domain protein
MGKRSGKNRSTVPEIHVGILLAEKVTFQLRGIHRIGESGSLQGKATATMTGHIIEVRQEGKVVATGEELIMQPENLATQQFMVSDVVIGIGFHWEQKEEQVFRGALRLLPEAGKIRVINVVPLEEYLVSVISSEMRGDSAPALLKAHTIISRSWLLAQIEKQQTLSGKEQEYSLIHKTEDEYIRWYDREDHDTFHVCADDHCQRYQGLTRAANPVVEKAAGETAGEVLVYRERICDARFSKCCGGITETFENCWEPVPHPYLVSVEDLPAEKTGEKPDLTDEPVAGKFILDSPEAFCNTDDAGLLRQVLNDYDQESPDFYRWKLTYRQEELAILIREKSGHGFGEILDLVPVERGPSGRLIRLKIVGSKKSLVVGKELEIRRWLSPTHLYSSAFVVEKEDLREGIPQRFTLSGAGWGHGVGLCQIGAAVMASRGYDHTEILEHYFRGARIEKRYEESE